MTASELATQLRRVRQTHDMVELRVMVARALMRDTRDDATDTLLHAIGEKMGRIAQSN
jgi:hypothetical protein